MNLRPCPFCGEKLRVKIVQKHMRRANGRDFAPAAYGYCLKCKSRGHLIVGDAKDVMNNAAVAWNGFTATPTELGPLFGIDYGTKSETVIMRAEVTDHRSAFWPESSPSISSSWRGRSSVPTSCITKRTRTICETDAGSD